MARGLRASASAARVLIAVDAALRNAWEHVPATRAAFLRTRRTRIVWRTSLAGCLVVGPWILPVLLLVGYVAQPLPRRVRGVIPVLVPVVPLTLMTSCAQDLGLIDDSGATSMLAIAGLGLSLVGALHAAEVYIRTAALPREPAAWGIPPQRVLLGRRDDGWVAAPRQVGALVIGPPRSGKTSGVVIPNVMSWRGPVVATSTRRDVLDACSQLRSGRGGAVWCCEPLRGGGALPSGVHRLDWSPLRGCADWDTATARARALTAGSVRGIEDSDHWRSRATQLLAGLLHAAALGGLRMSSLLDWVQSGRLEPALRLCETGNASRAAAVLSGIARTPERERGSIWSAVAGVLAPFDLDAVRRSADAADDCAFDTDAFLHGEHTLFIVTPSDAAVSLAPLVVGLVEEIRIAALRMSDSTGSLRRPLLLALDEIATICPLPSLPQIAAEGGGRNIILLAALQDLSQAAERWGRDVSGGLLTLAGAKLALPGIADTDTLQRLESLSGKQWVPQLTTTDSTGPFWSGTWSMSRHRGYVEQPRFPAAAIRGLRPETALVIVGNASAEVIDLALHHKAQPFRYWTNGLLPTESRGATPQRTSSGSADELHLAVDDVVPPATGDSAGSPRRPSVEESSDVDSTLAA